MIMNKELLNKLYQWLFNNTEYNTFRSDGTTIFAADEDSDTEEVYSSTRFDAETVHKLMIQLGRR